MDFQARCIQFLGETTGVSKAGNPWKKKEWVMETYGTYPKKVKVQCFGDRSDSMNIEQGKDYMLSVDLESREFNGRWYTDVSVFRAEMAAPPQGADTFGGNGGGFPSQPQQPMTQPYGGNMGGGFGSGQEFASDSSDEDLPF